MNEKLSRHESTSSRRGSFALRRRLAAMLCAGCLALAGDALAEPPTEANHAAPETWHAVTYVTGSMGLRIIDYWSKGPWMRAETLINGHPIVTIVRNEDYFVFDRLTSRGVRIRRAPAARQEDRERARPFGNDFDELVAKGAEKVEEVDLAGRKAEIWRLSDSSSRRKLWVTKDEPRLPIRLETFVRGSSETVKLDYSSWGMGIDLPDAFFGVPPEVDLEELEYESYLEAAPTRPLGPVLYPELLHGGGAR